MQNRCTKCFSDFGHLFSRNVEPTCDDIFLRCCGVDIQFSRLIENDYGKSRQVTAILCRRNTLTFLPEKEPARACIINLNEFTIHAHTSENGFTLDLRPRDVRFKKVVICFVLKIRINFPSKVLRYEWQQAISNFQNSKCLEMQKRVANRVCTASSQEIIWSVDNKWSHVKDWTDEMLENEFGEIRYGIKKMILKHIQNRATQDLQNCKDQLQSIEEKNEVGRNVANLLTKAVEERRTTLSTRTRSASEETSAAPATPNHTSLQPRSPVTNNPSADHTQMQTPTIQKDSTQMQSRVGDTLTSDTKVTTTHNPAVDFLSTPTHLPTWKGHVSKRGRFVRLYRSRYVEIHDKYLTYYQTRSDYPNKPRGCVVLRDCTLETQPDKNRLQIVLPPNDTRWYFQAETETYGDLLSAIGMRFSYSSN